MDNKKSSTGLQENIAGLLCYVLGWITGILFIIIEKESKFVKFHAIQSTVVFAAIFIANMILKVIPFIGALLSTLLTLLSIVLWLFLMYNAYQGKMYKLPIAGDIAEKQS
ncbi:MAG: DUF4870 domain-containing protein [Firmicutes bacterium]|nr:DUF4870 domain-containing protein [Bacillota bacterium]